MLNYLERQTSLTGNQRRIIVCGRSRRHARVLRLLPDWLRGGIHCGAMETDVRAIGIHSAVLGIRCDVRRGFLWLGLRTRLGAAKFPHDGAELFDRYRHFDVYPRQRLAVPGHISFPDRIWRRGTVLRGPSSGARIRACFKNAAWLEAW